MANCYGSKEYNKWVNEYTHGFTFTLANSSTIKYGSYSITFCNFVAETVTDGVINKREKTRLTVLQNNKELYACNCIDSFMAPYFFSRNGIAYLLFKKSLYGYTLLNLADVSEENYFPSAVLQNEEAFIITQAAYYNNVLFLNGCYWADTDDVFIMDLDSLHTYSINKALNILETGYESFIDNKTVSLVNNITGQKSEYTFDECIKLIGTKEPTDM